MSAAAVFHPRATSRRTTVDDGVASGILVGVVHVCGPVDGGRVGPVERELSSAMEAGATRLLVDLGEVSELTTTGLNVLLAARQRMLERRGRIAVVLPRRLRRQFELLDLDRRFAIASTRLQAARLLGLAGGEDGSAAGAPHAHAA